MVPSSAQAGSGRLKSYGRYTMNTLSSTKAAVRTKVCTLGLGMWVPLFHPDQWEDLIPAEVGLTILP